MKNKISVLILFLFLSGFLFANASFATSPGMPYKLFLNNASSDTIKIVHVEKDAQGKINDSSYCVEYSALPTILPGKQAVIELDERFGCQHPTLRHEQKFAIFTVVAVDESKKETDIGTLFFGFKGHLKQGLHKNASGGEKDYSPIINQLPEAPISMKRSDLGFEKATITFENQKK